MQMEYGKDANNKIILATDGNFNVSEQMLEIIGTQTKQNIRLSVLNYATQPSQKLKDLAKVGGGNFNHIVPGTANQILMKEAESITQRDESE